MLAFLLKPKVLAALGGVIAVIALSLFIHDQITDYGAAQFKAGKKECEAAVEAKAADTKDKLEANKDAAEAEADKTDAVYTEVQKDVAATDARIIAENAALKSQLANLKEEIDNAKPDLSACASEPIPAHSLSIHTKIDRLLRSGGSAGGTETD